MTQNQPRHEPIQAPLIPDLFKRFLDARGLSSVSCDPAQMERLVPFDTSVASEISPNLAWEESLAAFRLVGIHPDGLAAPPIWSNLVSIRGMAYAIPLALGNYPQALQSYTSLLQSQDPSELVETSKFTGEPGNLEEWADAIAKNQGAIGTLLAAGMMRSTGQLEAAARFLAACRADDPRILEVCENEKATLSWEEGRFDEAEIIWRNRVACISACFNLGVACLFRGKATEAQRHFAGIANRLPRLSGWFHLCQVYRALADIHG